MKSLTINASQRESLGKKATKALRNAGQVPCVIYGGDTVTHFAAHENLFSKLVYTPDVHTVVIELDNGTKLSAILQDIQFHPTTDKILHIDFVQIFDDKAITMEIPVRTTGKSPGVANGGNLKFNARRLKVKGVPGNLPDVIEANISALKIGDKVYVTTLDSEGFEFLHADNTVVCQVKNSRNSIAEDEAEAAALEAEGAEAPAEAAAE